MVLAGAGVMFTNVVYLCFVACLCIMFVNNRALGKRIPADNLDIATDMIVSLLRIHRIISFKN